MILRASVGVTLLLGLAACGRNTGDTADEDPSTPTNPNPTSGGTNLAPTSGSTVGLGNYNFKCGNQQDQQSQQQQQKQVQWNPKNNQQNCSQQLTFKNDSDHSDRGQDFDVNLDCDARQVNVKHQGADQQTSQIPIQDDGTVAGEMDFQQQMGGDGKGNQVCWVAWRAKFNGKANCPGDGDGDWDSDSDGSDRHEGRSRVSSTRASRTDSQTPSLSLDTEVDFAQTSPDQLEQAGLVDSGDGSSNGSGNASGDGADGANNGDPNGPGNSFNPNDPSHWGGGDGDPSPSPYPVPTQSQSPNPYPTGPFTSPTPSPSPSVDPGSWDPSQPWPSPDPTDSPSPNPSDNPDPWPTATHLPNPTPWPRPTHTHRPHPTGTPVVVCIVQNACPVYGSTSVSCPSPGQSSYPGSGGSSGW
jgi:hypothetical protein